MSPLAALLIDWALTALWPIIGSAGTKRYSPALFTQAGLAIGFLTLVPALLRKGRLKRLLAPELRLPFFVVGFLGSGLPSLIFVNALDYTSPANAAIVAQAEVLYSILLCRWLLKEKLSGAQAGGSLLVVMGTVLILAKDITGEGWKGDLMILSAPWMFQISHIYAKKLPADLDAVVLSAGRMLNASLAVLPFTLWTLAAGGRWSWEPSALRLLLFQGVVMFALNHVLWYLAIRRMDLSKATAIMLSYPALTVLYCWALGRGDVHLAQWLGLGLTMGGAYAVSLTVLKQNKGEVPAEVLPLVLDNRG